MTLDENVKGIEQLNALIKEHTKDILQSKWKVGDLCLVFCRCPLATTNETAKQWNRGKIVEINSVQNSTTCFLTDYGHKINVELSSLMEMPEKFDRVLEGVTKCHLSSCIPTGKTFKDLSV